MQLNGWQRLWVVTALLWLAIVLAGAWQTWPTSAGLADDEISARLEEVPDAAIRLELTPAENAILSGVNATEFLIGKVGGRLVNPYVEPDLKSVPTPDPELAVPASASQPASPTSLLSVHDFAQRVKLKYPETATISDDVLTASVLAKYPQYRGDVDPHALAAASKQFDALIEAQSRVSKVARTIAERTRIRSKQRTAALTASAVWAVIVILLYALGWSVGWVRRGFK